MFLGDQRNNQTVDMGVSVLSLCTITYQLLGRAKRGWLGAPTTDLKPLSLAKTFVSAIKHLRGAHRRIGAPYPAVTVIESNWGHMCGLMPRSILMKFGIALGSLGGGLWESP